MVAPLTTNLPTHPVRAGRTNAGWYIAAQLLAVMIPGELIATIVVALRQGDDGLWAIAGLAAAVLCTVAARRWAQRKAWEGAAAGPDTSDPYVLITNLVAFAVWVAGGVYIATILQAPDPHLPVIVGGGHTVFVQVQAAVINPLVVAVFGAWTFGTGTAASLRTSHEGHWIWNWNLPAAMGVSWVVIGLTSIPAGDELLHFGGLCLIVAFLGFILSLPHFQASSGGRVS